MAQRFAPLAHKVAVRHIATGQIDEVWPVDARERVSHPKGGWEYVVAPSASVAVQTSAPDGAPAAPDPAEPPAATPVSAAPAASPAPVVDARALLEEKSNAELQALGKTIGLNPKGLKRDGFIDALLPHVASGAISLAPVQGLPRDPTLGSQFPNAAPPES